ncbi:glycoside hydrolase family 35 protein [Alloacidobacterium sp.]|uniref:glycoside hydrolase family 35 protein n=1 Tax=Alloacidobacterium sp. TaxID=2951999 RepID=UPI002D40D59F|nr:glycoside hydrolase family 35 protein [Alloacidobacterium sp.]HYK38047.1 glycoside hydrolase family 35 protein [Alloacidobacterium sp.]
MKRIAAILLFACVVLLLQRPIYAEAHTFKAENGHFTLDGKPFQVISGEMHYARIPRAYWRDRMRMAKAMGLNTITTYVFWNVHEPKPGVYDFSGNNDVVEFIREAQQEGLYVILRPGPYACAEWEFGGFPSWLLKDHSTVVRSSDPKFIEPARRWILRLGKELAPLQIGNGGPIILVQVENEYGSFDKDHAYMEQIRHMLVDAGFTKSQLYTADGPEEVPNGSLPELPAAINFGPGESQKGFAYLKKLRPDGPFMNSEYWDGWFDHWGAPHAKTDAQQQAADIDWTLRQGYSISLYMFHGGTSFGWMNGANSNGKNYEPDVTSYDYDSPLDESGRPTAKYFLFRDTIAKATGITPPPVPQVAPAITIPFFTLTQSASLWDNLPKPTHSEQPLSMEDLDQAYGYIFYRTTLKGLVSGDLVLDQLHDYARIYIDGKLVGTLDRRLNQNSLPLNITAKNARLDILIENTGRVNFTKVMRGERKGITKEVTLAGKPVTGWDIYPLPMIAPDKLTHSNKACIGPCFYRATFNVDKPADTFLDTSAFTKGEVWLNGHALGRVWNIGPQKTLYVPGTWLKSGANEVVVFDLEGAPGRSLQGLDHPILNGAIKK